MKKILITGVNGFIGNHLATRLAREGYDVYGTSQTNVEIEGVKNLQCDILDYEKLESLFKEKDCIIHLAAVTENKKLTADLFNSLKVNLLGLYNALAAFEKSKAQIFIFPSSGKVYGKPEYLPYDEKHPLNPSTPLGKIKKILEELISFFAENSNKYFIIARIFNVYGPLQKKTFLIPTILSQLDNKEMVLGDVSSKRDYIYIEDLINAFTHLINLEKQKSDKNLDIFNVGTGKSYSAEEIVNEVCKILDKGIKIAIDKNKLRRGEFSDERADIGEIMSLGWKPVFDMRKGLSDITKNNH